MSSASPAGETSADVREIELSVQGMTCAACAARIEKKLNRIDRVAATVNYATAKASVTAPVSVSVQVLIGAVQEAGYPADLAGLARGAEAGPGAEADDGAERRRLTLTALSAGWSR